MVMQIKIPDFFFYFSIMNHRSPRGGVGGTKPVQGFRRVEYECSGTDLVRIGLGLVDEMA